MGRPLAKQGDTIVGLDTHVVLVSSPGGPVPTPMPMPFSGPLTTGLSQTVFVDHKPVATVGSGADNAPPHVPLGGPFQRPPANKATVSQGSATVFIDHKAAARAADPATCCNDPADVDTGHVVAASTTTAG